MRPRAVPERARGFTLLEMLMVVLFTSIVLTFAASFTVDLAQASRAAIESSAELRRAASVLDRVARDLEVAVLVEKPDAVDPLEHPWLFLAEGGGSGGAERLRFQARNHRPRAGAGHESDLAEIAYWLVPGEDGRGFDLLRFSSASPPLPPLARSFPRRDDPGVERLASGVAHFGVRLQNADGAWLSAWDSWSPAQSSQLPVAAEVQVALLPEEPEDETLAEPEPELFTRPLVLALDPFDLEEALGAESDEEEDEEEDLACVTVSECVARNQPVVEAYVAENPEIRGILDSIADQCWQDHAGSVPIPVAGCE
jgi:prepilin-type N-terminal cleavage/methylation domain-containing protein